MIRWLGWEQGRDYTHVLGEEDNIAVLAIEDPYTPVMVIHKYRDCSSTYDAAYGEGELLCNRNEEDYYLSEDECALLEKVANEVEEWFDEQRPEGWDG
jgi:hypothetical protein